MFRAITALPVLLATLLTACTGYHLGGNKPSHLAELSLTNLFPRNPGDAPVLLRSLHSETSHTDQNPNYNP